MISLEKEMLRKLLLLLALYCANQSAEQTDEEAAVALGIVLVNQTSEKNADKLHCCWRYTA